MTDIDTTTELPQPTASTDGWNETFEAEREGSTGPLYTGAPSDLPAVPSDEDEDSDEDAPADGKAKARPGRPARGSGRVTARTVRAIRAKVAELEGANEATVSLLAASLGTKTDIDEIVAHIIATPRLTLTGFAELEAIVEVATDPFAAMAKAMQYETQAKAIWAILATLGLVDGAKPAKESEASMAIARAAVAFTPDHARRLDDVRQLARKAA